MGSRLRPVRRPHSTALSSTPGCRPWPRSRPARSLRPSSLGACVHACCAPTRSTILGVSAAPIWPSDKLLKLARLRRKPIQLGFFPVMLLYGPVVNIVDGWCWKFGQQYEFTRQHIRRGCCTNQLPSGFVMQWSSARRKAGKLHSSGFVAQTSFAQR